MAVLELAVKVYIFSGDVILLGLGNSNVKVRRKVFTCLYTPDYKGLQRSNDAPSGYSIVCSFLRMSSIKEC